MTTPLRVHGSDVSHHQGQLDLAKAKAEGLRFLYHKATEGDSFVDREYAARRTQAAEAGLRFGAYHFARAERGDARDEARHFLEVAQPESGDLIPVLDLETAEGLTQTQLKRWAKVFSNEVKREVGVLPVLYSQWEFEGLRNIRWVPRYNSTNTPPTIPWDVWQFSDGVHGVPNSFPGLGHVDLNHLADGFRLRDLTLRPSRPELDLVTFNVWVGQKPDALRRNLIRLAEDLDRPDVMVLQEAGRFQGSIPGYERFEVESGRPEADSTILLIRRRGVDIRRDRSIEVDGPNWVGPKHGKIHQPRDYPGTSLHADCQTWDVLGVHRTPGGPSSRNSGSWAAEHRELRKWCARLERNRPKRPAIIIGDQNDRRSNDEPRSISALAEEVGGHLVMRGIDGAILLNAKAIEVRELDSLYGSDVHHPVYMRVVAA